VADQELPDTGELRGDVLDLVCGQVAELHSGGEDVVMVTSGAIARGMRLLELELRPSEIDELQAASAVGQGTLFRAYESRLAERNVHAAQVLLTSFDLSVRMHYLNARRALRRLLEWRAVPVVNENDTTATDEITFGDNDFLSAQVALLLGARLLVLLTDTAGLHTADPRLDAGASLIQEIVEVDAQLEAVATAGGSGRGSGGMASKLAAAKIAAWSGVRAVIAAAAVPDVIPRAVAGEAVGTVVRPRTKRLNSRKLWIAFAQGAHGRLVVDDGARRALLESGRSLLPAGVREVEGSFDADDAVEVIGPDGRPFAKGLVRYSSVALAQLAGSRTSDLPEGSPHEVIHRDDLVVLPS
jgi:glutamate 5-kinase